MQIKLNNVRLAFPELWEARQVNGQGEPKFGGSFILSKDSTLQVKGADGKYGPAVPAHQALEKVIQQVAAEKWKTQAAAVYGQLKAQDKLCLHDGNTKPNYDGFPGHFYVSANNGTRPLVIDRNQAPLAKADGKPYSGCYVNVSLDIWAQDNKYGKRVNAGLRGVQFAADGEAFAGGGAASEDEFEPLDAPAANDFADLGIG